MVDVRIELGQEVAGYRIAELAGRGGMGEVYRAHDTRLDRNVALKVLAPRYAEDEEFRERLLRESRLAASLDHPNVVPVYDAGEADGRFFLAMRYVEGTDLRALLRREGALEPARALEIAAQVAGALDAAHERGLVHRDVKPSNVLIDERGHCYLADFGLTQSVSDRGLATDGSMLGTLDYVAPEQIRGDEVDHRADLYALGCLVFECLTGEVPFRRPSDVATIYAHLEEEPPRASEQRPELPAAVDAVLAQAMAKDPRERQATCADLLETTRDALGLGIHPFSRPRRLLLALATSALTLALAAGALVLVLARGDGAPPVRAGSLVRIDPGSGEVAARTRVPGYPGIVAAGPAGVWMADFREGMVWRFAPRTGALQRVSSSGNPRDLALLGNSVYVASDGPKPFSGNVTRFSADTGVREAAIELLACAVAAGDGVVWAAGCPAVQRLSTDAKPLRILRDIPLPFASPLTAENHRIQFRELTVGEGSLWVLGDALDRRLWRLDPRTGRVRATIDLPFPPRTVAAGEGGVWVTDPLHDTVVRIEPRTNRVSKPIRVGRGAAGVAVGADAVWVANTLDGTVSRVDPTTAAVVATVDVGGLPREVAVGSGGIWVTSHAR